METLILFESEREVILEGLLLRSGQRAALVTHPHPVYGGDMHNPVVEAVCAAYQEKGCSTLRFNLRGVAGSGGAFDQGDGERRDIRAAMDYLLRAGIESIDLIGYSFGAWLLGNLELPSEVAHQIHIAPPVAFMDYAGVASIPRLRTVIAGENDDIAPPDQIRGMMKTWNDKAKLHVLPGGDHFFSNGLDVLKNTLSDQID